jgi:hypothetical protein
MVTKSEEDRTMTRRSGGRVDDYLVKPTSPRQVLSVVTRILEGSSIRQQQVAQDFAARFRRLSMKREDASTAEEFAAVYAELVDWHIRLEQAGEAGLLDSVNQLLIELRRDFGEWVVGVYPHWMRADVPRPDLSVDLVRKYVVPWIGDDPVFFVVLDCMRLDQWRVISPAAVAVLRGRGELALLDPADRDAVRAQRDLQRPVPGPDRARPTGLVGSVGRRGEPERVRGRAARRAAQAPHRAADPDPLREDLHGPGGRSGPRAHQVGAADAALGDRARVQLRGPDDPRALGVPDPDGGREGRGRAARPDALVVRALDRLSGAREAASSGYRVVLTTDHGSILCQRPTTVFARKDATANLRYKFGQDLRAENGAHAMTTRDQQDLRFPVGRLGTNYVPRPRGLLLRLSHQAARVSAALPELLPPRRHQPGGDDRPGRAA